VAFSCSFCGSRKLFENRIIHRCPATSRTDSIDCKYCLSRYHSRSFELPVKSGPSRTDLGRESVGFVRGWLPGPAVCAQWRPAHIALASLRSDCQLGRIREYRLHQPEDIHVSHLSREDTRSQGSLGRARISRIRIVCCA
jgi:hypothetical protein